MGVLVLFMGVLVLLQMGVLVLFAHKINGCPCSAFCLPTKLMGVLVLLFCFVNGRPIEAVKTCEDSGWFTFTALCDGPRSQNDYIELGSVFHTIILSDVPVLNADKDNQARRFINLVDEFYDRNVKLIISAGAEPEKLYIGSNLSFEFQRTVSRLQEMQSTEYLARPHKS